MGRRKIEIQPLTNERNRSVTFLKRKSGLFKKAHELSVLCSVDIAVLIVGSNNKLYKFTSNPNGDEDGELTEELMQQKFLPFFGKDNKQIYENKTNMDYLNDNDDDQDDLKDGNNSATPASNAPPSVSNHSTPSAHTSVTATTSSSSTTSSSNNHHSIGLRRESSQSVDPHSQSQQKLNPIIQTSNTNFASISTTAPPTHLNPNHNAPNIITPPNTSTTSSTNSTPSNNNNYNIPPINSYSSISQRPKLKVEIPPGNGPAHAQPGGLGGLHHQPLKSAGPLSASITGSIVLPPPSPSTYTTNNQGPGNPFHPHTTSSSSLNPTLSSLSSIPNSSINPTNPILTRPTLYLPESTPLSALPSRYVNELLPSPSNFYGGVVEWNGTNGGMARGDILPSPLQFSTPVVVSQSQASMGFGGSGLSNGYSQGNGSSHLSGSSVTSNPNEDKQPFAKRQKLDHVGLHKRI